MRCHIQHQSRFADSGIPAKQDESAGNNSSAQDTIEFVNSGRDPWKFDACNFRKANWR